MKYFRNIVRCSVLDSPVMEPLSPQDPLHRLLGKTRPVEPRGDFTQNVLRAVRQLPQSESVWERVQGWFAQMTMPRAATALAFAAVLALGGMALWSPVPPQIISAPLAMNSSSDADLTRPTESDVASELDGMNQLTALLAQQDTSALTDSDIAFLLY